MDQDHENPFIPGQSIIGTQDIRNDRNTKKVSRYGSSLSRFRGGRAGGATTPSRKKNTTKRGEESRDDGDQQHSRQLKDQNQKSTIIGDSSGSFVGKQSDSDTLSRMHQDGLSTSMSSSSLATAQLDFLLEKRHQLTERLQDLETQFDSLQKQKAYAKSMFAMKQAQLLVEIEGLREDHVFLTRKRDKLGRKLLTIHMKRVERMESDEQLKEERESRQLQRSGSQTSF